MDNAEVVGNDIMQGVERFIIVVDLYVYRELII